MNGGRKEYRQSAEKLLRKAYKNSNRKRGLVLALTSGMLMLLGMLLLGFIQGKIRADQLRYLRENGSVVDTYVENGTEKTAEILKNFQMIRQIGLEKVCGKLMDNGIVYCECSVMEEQDWEKLKAAAYTDIYGAYPEEANEIMLSQKTLEFLGIRQPEIGMELSLEFHWNSVFIVKGTGRQNFILSGYYTDYRKDASNFSAAYLSKKKLEQADLTEFPCRILLDMKDSLRSGEQTEMLLRESIALGEDEYFVSEDSAFYKSVRGIAGSFGIGAFLLILLVLCAVLLIYQLIRISFVRDVRQYGIMRTIGVTVKQIRRVVYRQVLWDIFKGTILGGVLSCLIIGCVFPAMMTKMYMGGSGRNGERLVFVGSFLCRICPGCLYDWVCHGIQEFPCVVSCQCGGDDGAHGNKKNEQEKEKVFASAQEKTGGSVEKEKKLSGGNGVEVYWEFPAKFCFQYSDCFPGWNCRALYREPDERNRSDQKTGEKSGVSDWYYI